MKLVGPGEEVNLEVNYVRLVVRLSVDLYAIGVCVRSANCVCVVCSLSSIKEIFPLCITCKNKVSVEKKGTSLFAVSHIHSYI